MQKLDARRLKILKTLIEQYINDGQPIGSKTLATRSKTGLSAASIRHIMADLEAAGFISSPHTSAGRVPTVQGYRLFVDQLIMSNHPSTLQLENLQQHFSKNLSAEDALKIASNLLSSMTNLVGVVTLPKREQHILKHLEFLPLSNNRVLVILVLEDYEVQNRIIYTEREYGKSELEQAGNYLTTHYAGKDLNQIHDEIISSMQLDKKHVEKMMQAVIEMAQVVFDDRSEQDYLIEGVANLIPMAEETDVSRLKSLFDAFAKKRSMLHLLDQCLAQDGLNIFIGEETGIEVFDDVSLVTAPYQQGQKIVGVLGVIGPTRMNYRRAIHMVDVTAKLLSAALK